MVSNIIKLGVYALTLIGATIGSIVAGFEILPEGRLLRVFLLVVALVCALCNLWLKWQDTVESDQKSKLINEMNDKLKKQAITMKTLMANSMPSKRTLEDVNNKFVNRLLARGWRNFSRLDFSSQDELIIGYCKKRASDDGIESVMWLHSSEINLLDSTSDEDFAAVADALIDQKSLEECKDLDAAWNQISKAFMPALLLSYDVRVLNYNSAAKTIQIPLRMLDVERFADDSRVEIRSYDGEPCVWVTLDSEMLKSFIGATRVEISRHLIRYISSFLDA